MGSCFTSVGGRFNVLRATRTIPDSPPDGSTDSFIHSFIPSFIHSVIHSSWGPVDGNFAACRKCCCRPRPETGLVAPYLELKAQQMRYDVPYVALIAIATVIAILAAACGAIPSK